jgi:hypothetical protein
MTAGFEGRLVALRLFVQMQLPSPTQADWFVYCVQIGLHTGVPSHDCHWQREFSSHSVVAVLRLHDLSHLPVFQFQKHLGSASHDATVVYAWGHISWHVFLYHSHAPTKAMQSARSVIVAHGAEHVLVVFDHMQSESDSHSARVKYLELHLLRHLVADASHAQWSVPVQACCVVSALQLRTHMVIFCAFSFFLIRAIFLFFLLFLFR